MSRSCVKAASASSPKAPSGPFRCAAGAAVPAACCTPACAAGALAVLQAVAGCRGAPARVLLGAGVVAEPGGSPGGGVGFCAGVAGGSPGGGEGFGTGDANSGARGGGVGPGMGEGDRVIVPGAGAGPIAGVGDRVTVPGGQGPEGGVGDRLLTAGGCTAPCGAQAPVATAPPPDHT